MVRAKVGNWVACYLFIYLLKMKVPTKLEI